MVGAILICWTDAPEGMFVVMICATDKTSVGFNPFAY